MKAPISVCFIVKNESAQLENCLQSIRDYVEEIIIIDTALLIILQILQKNMLMYLKYLQNAMMKMD